MQVLVEEEVLVLANVLIAGSFLRRAIKHIIFISSTSVYPNNNQKVFEHTPIDQKDHVLLKAEALLKKQKSAKLTILRCAGLMGYDRIPGKYFAGRKNLTTGDLPVNYIHRDDVILIISEIIQKNIWGEIFNLASPVHCTRKEIFIHNAEHFNYQLPTFTHSLQTPDFKIVDSTKLERELDYTFKYPNPLGYQYTLN